MAQCRAATLISNIRHEKKNDVVGLGVRSHSTDTTQVSEVQVYFTRNGNELGHTTHKVPDNTQRKRKLKTFSYQKTKTLFQTVHEIDTFQTFL